MRARKSYSKLRDLPFLPFEPSQLGTMSLFARSSQRSLANLSFTQSRLATRTLHNLPSVAAAHMKSVDGFVGAIGNTPLIRLNRLSEQLRAIYAVI